MLKPMGKLECEVCGSSHRAARWRTQPSGSVVLCISCRCAVNAILGWRQSHPATPLDDLAKFLSNVVIEDATADSERVFKAS